MKLPANWPLPAQIRSRFGNRAAGRQRAMSAEGHLLLVLHKKPSPDAQDREAAFFWRNPRGEWQSADDGAGVRALIEHLDAYASAEDVLEKDFHSADTAEDYFTILQAAAPLMRASRNMHAALQAAREAIPEDRDLIDLRDWAGDLERNFDLLYTDSKNALDYAIARKAEEEAELSRQAIKTADRLNVIAAIFLPLTAIASVFGMQLHHGLEARSAVLFWAIFLVGIGLGLIVRAWAIGSRAPEPKLRLPAARKAGSPPRW